MKKRTRLLGVDYGTKRIGLAVTDADRVIASPLATYERKDKDTDARFFLSLVENEEIGAIVVGLPVHLDGRIGEKAREAQDFAKWVGQLTELPVHLYDERFTSVEAEHFLLDAGLTKKRRKSRMDRVAAQILLQSYLDAGCPEGETLPGALDE